MLAALGAMLILARIPPEAKAQSQPPVQPTSDTATPDDTAARALLRDMLEVARLPAIGDRDAVERIFGVRLQPDPRWPHNFEATISRPGVQARLGLYHDPSRPPDNDRNTSSLGIDIHEPCITPDTMRAVLGTVYLDTSMGMRRAWDVPESEVCYIFAESPPRYMLFEFLGQRCARSPVLLIEGGHWAVSIVNLARNFGVWR
jgi:hypothetical protein